MSTSRILLCSGLLLSCLASAKNWTIGGSAGMAKNGDKLNPTASIAADYKLSDLLSWNTNLGMQMTDASNMNKTAFQFPTNLMLHPLGAKSGFDPYIGPGLNASVSTDQKLTAGYNALGGFMVHTGKGPGFGLEMRYTVADMNTASKGQLAAALKGSWQTKF